MSDFYEQHPELKAKREKIENDAFITALETTLGLKAWNPFKSPKKQMNGDLPNEYKPLEELLENYINAKSEEGSK